MLNTFSGYESAYAPDNSFVYVGGTSMTLPCLARISLTTGYAITFARITVTTTQT